MIEQVSRLRHLTETMPLSVYNEVFSRQPSQNGTVCYYDAAADVYLKEPFPSRASEVKVEGRPKTVLLK